MTWGTWPASLHKRFAVMLSFVVTRRMLNESSHLEYALRKNGDASFNTDSQSDLTKLPQISVACRDLGVGPRTGYLTPPVQRLDEQVSDPGKAARIAVCASDVVLRIPSHSRIKRLHCQLPCTQLPEWSHGYCSAAL